MVYKGRRVREKVCKGRRVREKVYKGRRVREKVYKGRMVNKLLNIYNVKISADFLLNRPQFYTIEFGAGI